MSSEEPATPRPVGSVATAWRRSLNLDERVRATTRCARGDGTNPPDLERGCLRLEQWRAQAPFASGQWFARRLAQAGVSEARLLEMLGEPEPLTGMPAEFSFDTSTAGMLPAWVSEIEQAYAAAAAPAQADAAAEPVALAPVALCARLDAGFLEAIRPLIARAVGRLRAGMAALASDDDVNLPDNANGDGDGDGDGRHAARAGRVDASAVEAALLDPLMARLLAMLQRTMMLELHVARLQGQLSGETSEQRFASFIEQLRQPAVALALLREYPVLARQICIAIDNWLDASLEFLARWHDDYATIRQQLRAGGAASRSDGGDANVNAKADANPNADGNANADADADADGQGDSDVDPLVGIGGEGGDSHGGGRAVMVAVCRSGFQVVYKPKPLAIDRRFQELLERVNASGFSTALRPVRVIDRGGYGWVEFVKPHGCASVDEVARFYHRQGGYLALLYVLAAMDFHHENVIAAGEHPVMIDVEALLHPRVARGGGGDGGNRGGGGDGNGSDGNSAAAGADFVTREAFDESVLASGLLPQRVFLGAELGEFDVSGIGAEAGGAMPWRYPAVAAAGTDEMHFARRQAVIDATHHRPTIDGAAVSAGDHAGDLEAGFREMYALLLARRGELLASNGWLDAFADAPIRAIFRGTSRYAEFLAESFHPDVLRDALDRDRLFDRLWEEAAGEQPAFVRLIPAEVADLWRNDIPFFVTRPGSRDVWGSTGEPIVDVFAESGISRARGRVARLGPADLERQVWFIRASMTTLQAATTAALRPRYRLEVAEEFVSAQSAPASTSAPTPTSVSLAPPFAPSSAPSSAPSAPPHYDRLLRAACAVGDRLIELSFDAGRGAAGRAGRGGRARAAGDTSWVGLVMNRDERWSLLPLGTDLYDGVPGVVLFLAHLGAVANEPRYTDTARRALRTLQRGLESAAGPAADKRPFVGGIGAFVGWGGIIYTLAHLRTLWREPKLIAQAVQWADVAAEAIEGDRDFDVISGAAGCIAAMLALDACGTTVGTGAAGAAAVTGAAGGRAMEVAVRCGERLLARAKPMPRGGVAWDTTMPATAPLTGFSHGAAGIGWALLELAARSGDARFRAAGVGAIAYERSVFSPQHANWADFRRLSGGGGERTSAGGEAQDGHPRDVRDARDATEEDASLAARHEQLSWCHGAPGIGLARLRCLRRLDDPRLRDEIDVAVGATLANGFGFNHTLCHGDLGNLELLLEASRAFPHNAAWRAATDRILAGILDSIERDGLLCANPRQVESPGLMTGIAGIGYAMLRHARPDVPSILILDPPAPVAARPV